MANWLVTIDEDETRRAAYTTRVRQRIAPWQGLETYAQSGPGWSVLWAAADTAPVSMLTSGLDAAFVWGEAITDDGHRASAAEVAKTWEQQPSAHWDGFYTAAVMREGRSWRIGADVLGLYPVYWWTDDAEVVLIGSSLDLFRGHPRFSPRVDPEGLVGIMLTNGLVDGRTLWQGVRRLAPGHHLVVRGRGVAEHQAYRIPLSTASADLPLAGHVRQLDMVLDAAMRRHVEAGRPQGLLLSGGADSRLLAGYLARQGHEVKALTFGRADDIEMICARGVARTLRFHHESAEVESGLYPEAAARLARMEGLAAGFCGVPEWGMPRALRVLPGRTVLGHVLDAVVGGTHVAWALDPHTATMGFEALWPRIAAWGVAPDRLITMLDPSVMPVVPDVLARIRAAYDDGGTYAHHRAWIFDLHHRQRFHVGSALWALSFVTWPVTPALDRTVLATAAAWPGSSLANRRAQFGVLNECFPRLAALPLDRNGFDMRPLQPRLRHHLSQFVRDRRMQARYGLLRLTGGAPREHRYYRRLYDLNAPGWQAVRRAADPYRASIPDIVTRDAIDAVLPAAGTMAQFEDPIAHASAAKLLIGLALWGRYQGEA